MTTQWSGSKNWGHQVKTYFSAVDPKTGLVVREANDFEISLYCDENRGKISARPVLVNGLLIDKCCGSALRENYDGQPQDF